MLTGMEADAARLGQHVRARRLALRLTQRQAAVAADVSDQTWLNVEQGKPVKPATLLGVDVALDWEPGSAEGVLEGREPRGLPESDQPKLTMDERLDRIERMLEQLLVEKEAEERAGGREHQRNR